MDWFVYAKNDWEIYNDKSRIAKFVSFGKITPEQYKNITGDIYED
jgi:uncharacterized XkdX family phage protein